MLNICNMLSYDSSNKMFLWLIMETNGNLLRQQQ